MNIKKLEIKSRVSRLLDGRPRLDDMKTILLYLRDNSFNKEMLKEIGHFSAHSGERVRGLATKHVQQVFDATFLTTTVLKQQLDDTTQLEMRKRSLRYRLDSVTAHQAAAAGLKIKDIHRRGKIIIKSLVLTKGDDVKFHPKLQPDDMPILRFLLRNVVAPAITDSALTDEMADACIKNRFITENDRDKILENRSHITRMVVSLIHGCEIALDGWSNANLTAGVDTDGSLVVGASFPIRRNDPSIKIKFAIFQTEEMAKDSCCPDLLTHDAWNFPIEVADNGLLTALY